MGATEGLPGPSQRLELGGHKVQVAEGSFAAPDHLSLQVLHEVPGLVAFVGRKDEKNRVLDAVPVFTDPQLSAVRAGVVLLCDMARDLTIENRLGANNFTLGNVDQLEQHVVSTYSQMTLDYLDHAFLGKPLGVDNSRFLAKRMTRTLRANYPALKKLAAQDKSRIVLKHPFTVLAKFDPNARNATLYRLACYLGETWVGATRTLLAKHPHLADRTQFFGDAA